MIWLKQIDIIVLVMLVYDYSIRLIRSFLCVTRISLGSMINAEVLNFFPQAGAFSSMDQ